MRNILNIFILAAFLFIFMSSGWVSYSAQKKECPTTTSPASLSTEDFLRAHGIAQENYSIWLKEHSEWRRKNEEELKCYSFIPKQNNSLDPQDFDTNRR